MTLFRPDLVPEFMVARASTCPLCDLDRRPRVFICDYHEGYWDGYADCGSDTERVIKQWVQNR